MNRRRLVTLASAVIAAAASGSAIAQVGTAFTYQGQLKNLNLVVNTPTDMQFSLWTQASAGSQVGSTVTNLAVPVGQGLFTTSVDFGVNPYTSNQALFLQIAVRNPAGSGSYVPMGSRQPLTAAPFSLATRGIVVDSLGRVSLNPTGPGSQNDQSFTVTAANAGMLEALGVSNGGLLTRMETYVDATSAGNPGGGRIRMQSPNVGYGPLNLNDAMTVIAGPSGGNVGIGTPSPERALHLKGSSVGMFFQNTADADGPNARWAWDTNAFGLQGIALVRYDGASANATRSVFVNNSGSVGIGVNPGAKLDVAGAARFTGGDPSTGSATITLAGPDGAVLSARNTGSGFTGWDVYMSGADYAISRSGIDFPFLLSASTGNAAIGTTTSSFKLDVGGAIRCTSVTQTSAREFKQDITPLTGALDSIMKLNGVSYAWNDKAPEQVQGKHDIGFLADEVNQVLPDIVAKDETGKPIGIDYGKVTPVTVEAIKQLKAENDALKARLEKIEALLAAQAAAR